MIIRSRAPLRLNLGGGGTDVSPYTEEHGGVCTNVAINQYAWTSLSFRDDTKIRIHSSDYQETVEVDHLKNLLYDGKLDLIKGIIKNLYTDVRGFDLHVRTEAPPRSGLGGSASVAVATIGLLNHLRGDKKLTPYEIAELAYHIERNELKVPGGRQDQYAAVFGGLNFMEFKGKDFVRVTPLKLKQDVLLELEKNMVLIRVPSKRPADILADQTKNLAEGKNVESLHKMKALAYEMKYALLREDLTTFGALLHESWEHKKHLSSLISNKEIDALYTIARSHGALGGKITGAGGGGHMIFYCKPDTEVAVKEALRNAGATPIDINFDLAGLQTWEVH